MCPRRTKRFDFTSKMSAKSLRNAMARMEAQRQSEKEKDDKKSLIQTEKNIAQTTSQIHLIAAGYGLPSYHVDGTWYESMYNVMPGIIQRMRRSGGPALIEAEVVRLDSHSSSDDQTKYRSSEELNDKIRCRFLLSCRARLRLCQETGQSLQRVRHHQARLARAKCIYDPQRFGHRHV